jgi:hypothetical protein
MPTRALITRMRMMTTGSTKAVGSSSKRERMLDTTATATRIWTRRSSNCSAMS